MLNVVRGSIQDMKGAVIAKIDFKSIITLFFPVNVPLESY